MATAEKMRLWYRRPAGEWSNALPIGNGRLGAMVFGQVHKECWQLNEDSVWYGGPRDRNPKDALRHLPQLRDLLDKGALQQAEELVKIAFTGMPPSQRHYEPLGQVNLTFPHLDREIANYLRYLDLESAVAGVQYEHNGVQFEREIFASQPQNVIAAKFSASQPGRITFRLRIDRKSGTPINDNPLDGTSTCFEGVDTNIYMDIVTVSHGCLLLKAQTGGNGVQVCLGVTVQVHGGKLEIIGDTIRVTNADSAILYIDGETTFREPDPQASCVAKLLSSRSAAYADIRAAHISDYFSLFSRVTLQISCKTSPSSIGIPTDERMAQARLGQTDLALIILYFQFGRYLLIASSRPGYKALPANLQGIWNESMNPTWGSKFTLNVNAEMNYWHAETTNLSECHVPFFDFLKRLKKNGEVTARVMYGCRGWVAHHNSDIWADTAPQDRWLPSTLWCLGGAWASTHIWEHYRFTGDMNFLQDMYGVLKGAVQFFLDFLVEKDCYLVTNPSLSPENKYRLSNGEEGSMCIGPTMDSGILFKLFTDFISSAQLLKVPEDKDMVDKVKSYRSRLPPLRIGRHGQILEWLQDYEEVEPGHRHISHLWALFPGSQITSRQPDLVNACKKTLERRAAYGGGHTGWSRAWMIASWARLGSGEEAARHIIELLRSSTFDSLLDNHPPFQIDGNFGATAAITEMIVQSHNDEIFFLPALPHFWSEGSCVGIRARGGFEVSLKWAESRALFGQVRSLHGNTCVLSAKQDFTVLRCGLELASFSAASGLPVSFTTQAGDDFEVYFVNQASV